MQRQLSVLVVLFLMVLGCTSGKNYKRESQDHPINSEDNIFGELFFEKISVGMEEESAIQYFNEVLPQEKNEHVEYQKAATYSVWSLAWIYDEKLYQESLEKSESIENDITGFGAFTVYFKNGKAIAVYYIDMRKDEINSFAKVSHSKYLPGNIELNSFESE